MALALGKKMHDHVENNIILFLWTYNICHKLKLAMPCVN